jgi:hypothetical protein
MAKYAGWESLYPTPNLTPDELDALIRRARAEQAQAIRSAIASLFRWRKSRMAAPEAKSGRVAPALPC